MSDHPRKLQEIIVPAFEASIRVDREVEYTTGDSIDAIQWRYERRRKSAHDFAVWLCSIGKDIDTLARRINENDGKVAALVSAMMSIRSLAKQGRLDDIWTLANRTIAEHANPTPTTTEPEPEQSAPAPEDNPAAQALDDLWKDIILRDRPDYGNWEYPGMAYRHIKAEFDELRRIAGACRLGLSTIRHIATWPAGQPAEAGPHKLNQVWFIADMTLKDTGPAPNPNPTAAEVLDTLSDAVVPSPDTDNVLIDLNKLKPADPHCMLCDNGVPLVDGGASHWVAMWNRSMPCKRHPSTANTQQS